MESAVQTLSQVTSHLAKVATPLGGFSECKWQDTAEETMKQSSSMSSVGLHTFFAACHFPFLGLAATKTAGDRRIRTNKN